MKIPYIVILCLLSFNQSSQNVNTENLTTELIEDFEHNSDTTSSSQKILLLDNLEIHATYIIFNWKNVFFPESDEYYLVWKIINANNSNKLNISKTEENILIDNLYPCTKYEVILKPVDSSHTEISTIVMTESEAPGSVVNLTSKYDGENKKLYIEWKPPLIVPQCVRFYNINVTFNNNVDEHLFPTYRMTSETKYIFENFPSENFTLRVQPEGEDFLYNGDQKTINHINRKETNCPMITDLNVTIKNFHTIILSWKNNKTQGNDMENYKYNVTWSPENADSKIIYNVTENNNITINTFESCMRYHISVTSILNNISCNEVTSTITTPSENTDMKNYISIIISDNIINDTIIKFVEVNTSNTCEKYYLKISLDGNEIQKYSLEDNAIKIDAKTLIPCINYKLKITRGDNTSASVDVQDFVIFPKEVVNLKVLDTTYNSINISWEIPDDCNLEYLISWNNKTITTNENNYLLTNLASCTMYNISVKPLTQETDVILKNISCITKPPEIEPSNLIIMSKTFNSLHLSWENELFEEGIYNYNVTWMTSMSDHVMYSETEETFISIENLNSCMKYNLSVMSFCQIDNKLISETITKRISMFPKQREILNLQIISKSNDSITLQWDLPAKCGQYVFNYNIISKVFNTTINETKVTIQKLKPCTEYNFTIAMHIEDDNFTWKSDERTINSFTLPNNNSQASLTINPGVTTLSLYWIHLYGDDFCKFSYSVQIKSKQLFLAITNHTSITFNKLEPCTTYDIEISVIYDNIIYQKVIKQATTLVSNDISLLNLTVLELKNSLYRISWTKPKEFFCLYKYKLVLRKYNKLTITWEGDPNLTSTDIDIPEECIIYDIEIIPIYKEKSGKSTTVQLIYKAEFSLDVRVQENTNNHSLFILWSEPPCLKGQIQNYSVIIEDIGPAEIVRYQEHQKGTEFQKENLHKNYTVDFHYTFHNYKDARSYNISISEINTIKKIVGFTKYETAIDEPTAPIFLSFHTEDKDDYTINITWLSPYAKPNIITNYVIEMKEDDYIKNISVNCNDIQLSKKLNVKKDKNYEFQIFAFISNKISPPSNMFFLKAIKTSKLDIDEGLLIGIIVTILVIAIIVIILYESRGRLSYLIKWPLRSTTIVSSEMSPAPQPVPIKKFRNYYKTMIENSGKIKSEFQLLQTVSQDVMLSTRDATQTSNKRKNRYINILPFDENRVKLNVQSRSDYINASFIKGYNNTIEYIAAQGPTEATCPAFWQMIHDTDIKTIVMLTQFVENGKDKCYKYFPNEMEESSIDVIEMKIQCLKEFNYEIYTLRNLIIDKNGTKKKLTHLLFNKWPDFGVPLKVSDMLDFCDLVSEYRKNDSGYILVHCSAGVGRTGTLIALDILKQAIKDKQKIDIFGAVFNLRKQRMTMVQSEKQYEFLYKCICQIVSKQDNTHKLYDKGECISDNNLVNMDVDESNF